MNLPVLAYLPKCLSGKPQQDLLKPPSSEDTVSGTSSHAACTRREDRPFSVPWSEGSRRGLERPSHPPTLQANPPPRLLRHFHEMALVVHDKRAARSHGVSRDGFTRFRTRFPPVLSLPW